MTLKLRLLLTIIPLVTVAILIMATVALQLSVSESMQALTNVAEEKLSIENRQTSDAIARYIHTVESQIRIMSSETQVIEAAAAFNRAYAAYSDQRGSLSATQLASLNQYYTQDFAGLYKQRNNQALPDATSLVTPLPATAKALQYDFIAGSAFPIGEKDSLSKLGNDTDYAILHEQYHRYFRTFLKEYGYYDIFIADANTGNIVYSVYKELDFATNLKTGPYQNTGIAAAFDKALQADSAQDVLHSSLDSYLPSYNAMAGFVSSPIVNNAGKTIAVLIYQIPLDVISDIMTHGKAWQESGLGASGETYIVSSQNTLVTESRFFLEDPDGYFKAVKVNLPAVAQQIKQSGTSVGIQPVATTVVKKALNGQRGFEQVTDYRGVEVFSSYSMLKIGDYPYAVLAEIDVDEALAAAESLKYKLLSGTLVAVIVIAGVAVILAIWLAGRLVRPLNKVGDACSSLVSGEGNLTIVLEKSNIPEINRIIEPFNQFIGQIRNIITQVKGDADSLASAAEELSAVTQQSEQNAIEQVKQTETVDQAISKLSASVAEVARSTALSRSHGVEANASLTENQERADYVADNIQLLVKLIKDSSHVITSLKNEVGQITDLLNVITSIADQTNLLALNAAIEAARAGEAGRGFSVVADEVRALANRSQQSTVEIGRLVDKMNISSEQSVQAMEKAEAAASGGIHLVELVTKAMKELSATIEQVQAMANLVSQATEEQEQTSQVVLGSVHNVNALAAEVRSGASQISSAALELANIATHTQSMVSRFKV
ncbi:methyl-accepting chemotaxis protein [Alteromonas lipolytica]|uniref:Chemotaxis protein n=1 Tax=Alteromonas lipolytica TaxID=1856405 RepID=A0A1E8FJC8_9ALTE|nr:methyl-accepting chemotaxis protein [Alteromonas lipolytica]OFI36037.1 hypothetical protein BFC17_10190 [Alteromonas lipolytica]GGF71474.1 methyl-accepting chemotaxis protein [Alteromonas lipolytica]